MTTAQKHFMTSCTLAPSTSINICQHWLNSSTLSGPLVGCYPTIRPCEFTLRVKPMDRERTMPTSSEKSDTARCISPWGFHPKHRGPSKTTLSDFRTRVVRGHWSSGVRASVRRGSLWNWRRWSRGTRRWSSSTRGSSIGGEARER